MADFAAQSIKRSASGVSVRSLTAPVPTTLPPQDRYLYLDKTKFADSFSADVDAEKAAFMADSQVPWGVAALEGAVTEPAWRHRRVGTWWRPMTG